MSLAANCFMLRAVVWNRKTQSLYQVEATGTLYEILSKFFDTITSVANDRSRVPDEPQVVVITKLDNDICLKNAILEELSAYAMSMDNLDEIEKEAREKYRKIYERDYAPPKIKMKYPCITICENEEFGLKL